jgi:hypothetical protein
MQNLRHSRRNLPDGQRRIRPVTDGLERLLAAGGVAFAVVLAAAAIVDDNQTDAYFVGLAAFFLIAFMGALRAALRAVEGETAPFSATAVIAGSVAAAAYAVLAAAYVAGGDVDPVPLSFAASFPQAAVLGAAGTVMVRTGAVSSVLGLAGQVLVPIQLGMPLVLLSTSDDFAIGFALAPFAVWVASAGVLLVRTALPTLRSAPTNGSGPRY